MLSLGRNSAELIVNISPKGNFPKIDGEIARQVAQKIFSIADNERDA
jgi:hypothetical protein